MFALRNTGKQALQRFYSAERFLWRLPAHAQAVALTFDDGPDPIHTPPLLDALRAAGIPATFFLIGEKVERHPELVRRMVEEGHAIGGHTWSHSEITALSADALAADLERCRAAMRAASGVDSVLFRPPRGKVNAAAIHRVCSRGYCLVHWTKTYSDYLKDGAGPLLQRMRRNPPAPRDIVLMHDHNAHTYEALLRAIPEWRERRLRFTALA
ncbi:polysaccharide deacetylase family protein [Oxalobacteraceae bacterium OM1]|nr:polysaccharide deacetylase family protein [Oxalobacteraceae bacterium OM1]